MKWRSLARVIALSDEGCYVVFPSYNHRIAVFVPSLPPDLNMALDEQGNGVYRTYAMLRYVDRWSDPDDLEPEWCE